MADSREALLEKLAALDAKSLNAEQQSLRARLLEIRADAAKRAAAADESDGPLMKALNLAEEAAQHGVRICDIQGELLAGK